MDCDDSERKGAEADADVENVEHQTSTIDDDSEDSAEEVVSNKNVDPDLRDLQKCDVFLQKLPYFDKIKANGFATFATIRANLLRSVVLNEIRPGFNHWSNRLISFIHEFSLYFTKSDHVSLIKLYEAIMLTPNIDLPTVATCLNVCYELLK